MRSQSEIKRYGKIVIFEHWLGILIIFILMITGLFLVRDWFISEFQIYGAENYIPTPSFARSFHLFAAFGILVLGAIHLMAHGGQKEKPILPKNSMVELKAGLYSLMYLIFLTKKQERGSGEKYLKSQRIIYAFTIYVLGLAAITGFLYKSNLLGEQMLIAHIIAGVLVLLVGIHRSALIIRKRDKIALRSILVTGTMPEWYIKKNHRAWYDALKGRGVTEHKEPKGPKGGIKEPKKKEPEKVGKPKEEGKKTEKGEIVTNEKPVPRSPKPSDS
ncbi:MAG: cytochrome b/b6 domain-containing protein [Methanomassiliicoccales archaeon]|nr:MAG: cytochrome b/b6 domain-containing protein [Methanomassiliicoccales archaeon]